MTFDNTHSSGNVPKFNFNVNFIEYFGEFNYRKQINKMFVKPFIGVAFSPSKNLVKNNLSDQYYKPLDLYSLATLTLGVDIIYPLNNKIELISGINFNRSYAIFENTWGINTVLNTAQWASINYFFDFRLGVSYGIK